MKNHELNELAINTIRALSMDGIQKANSGHPGAPMGLAPVAYTLYRNFMKFNPKNPNFPNRDRFVLSAGHASMLLYSTLHLFGYDVSMDDIKNFRQWGSPCAGHPEYGEVPGVETTTGPLGQGFATTVGMAIAEKWLKTRYNKSNFNLFDYTTFAIGGDGCMMEGVTYEAASLAGHLGLDNLIWLYDSNGITIEGKIDIAFSEDVVARFESYGWIVFIVEDANDLQGLSDAIQQAKEMVGKPALIIVKSHIAYGSPNLQDSHKAHGSPLGEDEIRLTKEVYGLNPDQKFCISEDVKKIAVQSIDKGKIIEVEWQGQFSRYQKEYPCLAKEILMLLKREVSENISEALPHFPADPKGVATRKVNGKILNAVTERVPWLIGGSADLGPSNNTTLNGENSLHKNEFDGKNIHFGIREHGMGAILNGLSLSGIRCYGGTFLVFSDYLRPALRLSAMMHQSVIYVFTHDSIGLGEDGPTHQPIEHLAALRAIPNLDVIRPGDANELVALWKYVLKLKDKPVALILTRQNLPVLDRQKYASADLATKGGYILADCQGDPEIILIGTGSEVQLCLEAHEKLIGQGIKSRVISMPCVELFEKQDQTYKEKVLPKHVSKRIAVEAGRPDGWYKYVGLDGVVIGIDKFGASAPAEVLFQKYGFTVENLLQTAQKLMD